MKRLLTAGILLLLLTAVVPTQSAARAQMNPIVNVSNLYSLNHNGYAVVNETVTYINNQSAPLTVPTITIGLGNLSSLVASSVLAGGNFSMNSPGMGGPFTVQPNGPLAGGSRTSFTVSSLVSGQVIVASNGSLRVLSLLRPSLSLHVNSLSMVLVFPTLTRYRYTPSGFLFGQNATNIYYKMNAKNVTAGPALTTEPYLVRTTAADFNPLVVSKAFRTITVGLNGIPMVTDTIFLKNVGFGSLSTLLVSPLTTSNGRITFLPATEPKLLNPTTVSLSSYSIDLASLFGVPLPANSNATITYQYPLESKYYSVSGSQVTLNLPDTPPLPNVVRSYTVGISLVAGVSLVQGQAQTTILGATQRTSGTTTFAYALAVAWAVDDGIPLATVVFVLLFVGLFVTRGSPAQEEEEAEEESSGQRVEAMIKAFDEKTTVINGLWSEIASKDPNEFRKEYFDELRGRLDSLRSKALQRLNDVKQKSTTQKFFDLLNQIHVTEREVDRAAKDKLNLYEQYHMRRMRKEVFDRLLPQYTKRLERGLNELSDELHVVQKEAKLL